jgi:hypothetical protein
VLNVACWLPVVVREIVTLPTGVQSLIQTCTVNVAGLPGLTLFEERVMLRHRLGGAGVPVVVAVGAVVGVMVGLAVSAAARRSALTLVLVVALVAGVDVGVVLGVGVVFGVGVGVIDVDGEADAVGCGDVVRGSGVGDWLALVVVPGALVLVLGEGLG